MKQHLFSSLSRKPCETEQVSLPPWSSSTKTPSQLSDKRLRELTERLLQADHLWMTNEIALLKWKIHGLRTDIVEARNAELELQLLYELLSKM
tara:strand:- start:507 stop:785 length:279 start_codon:yes stop_codon:yes gene_type:complete